MRRIISLLIFFTVISLGTAFTADCSNKANIYTLHYEVKLKSKNLGNMGTRNLWVKGNKFCWVSKMDNFILRILKNEQGTFLVHPWKKTAAQYPKNSDRGDVSKLMPAPAGPPKAFLKQVKAVKTGSEKTENQACDVYSYKAMHSGIDCKLWVNSKTGKPVKLKIIGKPEKKQDTIIAIYTKFEEKTKVPDKLFELPKDYKIRPMPEKKTVNKNQPAIDDTIKSFKKPA